MFYKVISQAVFKKIYKLKVFACSFFILFSCGFLYASSDLPLIFKIDEEGKKSLDRDFLLSEAVEIRTRDLNFPDLTSLFKGIRISSLVGKVEEDLNIVFFSEDQYVSQISLDFALKNQLMIAWLQDGLKIPPDLGGPQKLIFKNSRNLHPSLNAWYISAFALEKKPADFPLSLVYKGKLYEVKAEEALTSGKSIKVLPPVPKGYRENPASPGKKKLAGFMLDELMDSKGFSWSKLSLKPLVGRELVFSSEEIKGKGLFLFAYKEDKLLDFCCGGPWALRVPVLKHPELARRLPDSDALFWIYEISVE